MHATRSRPPVEVSADGAGVVSHAGSRLLADLADQTTLTGRLSAVFANRVAPQTAHDPGRVLVDLAVLIADGGEAISDIATLAELLAGYPLPHVGDHGVGETDQIEPPRVQWRLSSPGSGCCAGPL